MILKFSETPSSIFISDAHVCIGDRGAIIMSISEINSDL